MGKDSDIRLSSVKFLIIVAIILSVVAPYILTREGSDSLDFSKTGDIGDTIGGITSPIINLLAAILVYFALSAQVKANSIILTQIALEKTEKDIESETQNINQLYLYVNDSITNFKYRCLHSGYVPIRNTDEDSGDQRLSDGEKEECDLNETSGSTAFRNCFGHIRCNYHGDETTLLADPCVSEIYSILTIIDELLDRLKQSTGRNKEIIRKLIEHQFYYKVIASIRNDNYEDLKVEYCDHCKRDHGIPTKILTIVEKIKIKLTTT